MDSLLDANHGTTSEGYDKPDHTTVLQQLESHMGQIAASMTEMSDAWRSLASKRQVDEDDLHDDAAPQEKYRALAPDPHADEGNEDDEADITSLLAGENAVAGTDGNTASGSSLLEDIELDYDDSDVVGPHINDKLAGIINKRFSGLLSSDKIKQKQQKYPRPGNVEKLIVPDCNKVIKDLLRPPLLHRDKNFQYIQLAITKAATAITKATAMLLDSKQEENGAMVTVLTDAVAMLGHAHVQLSYKRRDAMSPALKNTYSGLTSTDVPITRFLFGDDIVKTLGDLKRERNFQSEARSFGQQSKNYRGRHHRPYHDRRQSSRGRQFQKNKGQQSK